MFDENTLGEEIKRIWGEFGAHYEVYKSLMNFKDEMGKVLNKIHGNRHDSYKVRNLVEKVINEHFRHNKG